MEKVMLTDRLNTDTQTIGELWESLSDFAQHRNFDNKSYNGEYPLKIRMLQMGALKSLVNAIDEFHKSKS